tara:strand:- start:450 stop:695 length:246 start_codon:yes stop_codon:yes gene_type:complete
MIHFRILDETLCGAPYTEPSAKAAKDGRLCNDCIQVMWKEQYRRNTVLKVKVKVNEDDIMEEHDDSEERGSRLYLIDFKKP